MRNKVHQYTIQLIIYKIILWASNKEIMVYFSVNTYIISIHQENKNSNENWFHGSKIEN